MLGKLFSGGDIAPSAQIPLSFRMPAEHALRLTAEMGYDALPTWRYLSHHIRRYPYDLRAHVQRILLAKDEELSSRLEGSLLDLFVALGNAGEMLKTRMLDLCADEISDETRQTLRDILDNGLADNQSTTWVHGSMLATGESRQPHKLLSQQRTEAKQNYSSLQAEVQDCLEYGQIEIAQELLETEILAGRPTPELEQELLTIYQHTRNKEGLEVFVAKLKTTDAAELTENWDSALNEAANW